MGVECDCPKCKGLLVIDKFHYFYTWIRGLRCVNCGWVKLWT